jgi:hypothetical protein
MKKIIIAMAGLATAIGVAWFSGETNQRPREQQVCAAKDVQQPSGIEVEVVPRAAVTQK